MDNGPSSRREEKGRRKNAGLLSLRSTKGRRECKPKEEQKKEEIRRKKEKWSLNSETKGP